VADRVRDPKGTYYEVDRSGSVRDLRGGGPPSSQSAIMVPLRLEGEVVGVVQVMADAEGVYTQGDLELLEGVSLLLAGALESVRPLVQGSGKQLMVRHPKEAVLLNADPVRLAQVFSNLLDNAVKYTGRNARIDVEVQRLGAEAVVSVRDDGVGIPPEHLPHLFDPFYQADRSLGRTHGGLGIGLTLVRRLVEMHGGTIEAVSDGPGCGSTFVVRLPALPREHSTEAAPHARRAVPRRPRRILIADDNQDSAEAMAMLLRLDGNEVLIAFDGEDAVRLADGCRPE